MFQRLGKEQKINFSALSHCFRYLNNLSYSPDRTETIYCETCYQQEVS